MIGNGGKSNAWLSEPRSANKLMVTVMLVMIVLNFAFAERIPIGKGLGWDGGIYASITRQFPDIVEHRQLNDYYIQRMLPSVLVHYGLSFLRLPMSNLNIIKGFQVLNALALLLAVYLWGRIADHYEIRARGRWLGFVALFVNYHTSNFLLYYPVLTDALGLALAFLMFFFHLKDRPFLLWLTALAGAFVFPTLPICAIPLLLLPSGTTRVSEPAPLHVNFLSILITVAAAAMIILGRMHIPWSSNWPPGVGLSVFLVGLLLAVGYVFLAVRPVVSVLLGYDFERLRLSHLTRMALLALLFGIVRVVVSGLRSSQPFYLTPIEFAYSIGARSVSRPVLFLIAHVIFFGPMFAVCLLSWRACVRGMIGKAPGLLLIVLLGIIVSLNSESRLIQSFYVMIVPFAVLHVESLKLNRRFYVWFLLISLLMTKLWLSTNAGYVVSASNETMGQRYFCNHGPWMGDGSYVIQGLVVVGLLSWLYVRFFRQSSVAIKEMEPADRPAVGIP
jgi:hypothetical protein